MDVHLSSYGSSDQRGAETAIEDETAAGAETGPVMMAVFPSSDPFMISLR
jgi:hypothetical protein